MARNALEPAAVLFQHNFGLADWTDEDIQQLFADCHASINFINLKRARPGSVIKRGHKNEQMNRDTIKHVIDENVGNWVRVQPVDGSNQYALIVNVDDEGFVNKINESEEVFWTAFDDVQAVWPAGDLTCDDAGADSTPFN